MAEKVYGFTDKKDRVEVRTAKSIDYGTELPSTGEKGDIFILIEEE